MSLKNKLLYIVILLISIHVQSLQADYNNITIKDFASIVATQNNINIVIDEDIDKEFSFIITKQIKAFTNLDVFTDLLDKNGLELQYKKNYYLIIKKEDKRVDKIEIYKTKNINADLAVKKIEPIISSFYSQSIQPKQEKSDSKSKKLTIKNKNDNNSSNVDQEEIYKDYSINAVDHETIVLTYKDDKIQQYTKRILANIDNIKKQLEIICKVYEVKTDVLEEKGIQLEAVGEVVSSSFNLDLKMANSLPSIAAAGSDLKINSIIRLLNDKENSKLLATPKINILEGQKGTFKEGETYPIKSTETTTTNSSTTNTVEKTEYIDIGLTLSIDYTYEHNNYNYLKVDLQKKDLLNYDQEQQDITTTNREIETYIRIKESQKIVLAGVSREKEEKKSLDVPYLSQLPILGELLKYKYKETNKTTLVITLSVRYIENEQIKTRSLNAKPGTTRQSLRNEAKRLQNKRNSGSDKDQSERNITQP